MRQVGDGPPPTAMVVVAAGGGTRFGGGANKILVALGDRPVLMWSLATFDELPWIHHIVLVARPDDEAAIHEALRRHPVATPLALVEGGPTRHDSERNGLAPLRASVEAGEIALIGIHDAARPRASATLVHRIAMAAAGTGGALPTLPPRGPLARRDPDGLAVAVRDDQLVRVQTPQIFAARGLLDAFDQVGGRGSGGLDTAATVERHGSLRIAAVAGEPENAKITYAEDLAAAEAALPATR